MAAPRFPPALGVAVAVVSVSFAAPLFTLANAPPLEASFWRLALATAMLLPFSRRAWPAWRNYAPREWLVLAAAGVALAAHFALWVTSLQMTSVAASTTLVTLQAVFVALGGHFLLRDRLGAVAWLGVGTAVAGSVGIALADTVGGAAGAVHPWTSRALQGDLLALSAGLGSAAYLLIGRRLRATRGLVEYVVPVYAVATLGLLAALLAWRQPLFASAQPLDCLAWLGRNATFALFVLLAAVPMLGGHTVANWTVRYLPAHTVATWILLEPVGAALLAWAIPCIHQVPSPWTAAGAAMVLAGAALTVRRRSAAAASEPAG